MLDLSHLAPKERDADALRRMREAALSPFDLARGSPIRFHLLKLESDDHVLVLVLHHIVCDGWSMGVLFDEVAAIYAARIDGRPSPLPGLAVQYGDYAVWQRGLLATGVLAAGLSYWTRQLAGAPAVLSLPTDRPRGARSDRGAAVTFALPGDLAADVRELARREAATPFMLLLAAFQALLQRCTDQRDLVVGVAAANRTWIAEERLIGVFINMLPIRARISPAMPFRELLAQTRETTLAAYVHQDIPFERVVAALSPDRGKGSAPLFQVAFGLENTPDRALVLPGLSVETVEIEQELITYDLTLWIHEGPAGLEARWTFSTDIFDGAYIERLHRRYEAFVRGVLERPNAAIGSVDLRTAAERAQEESTSRERQGANYKKLLEARPRAERSGRR